MSPARDAADAERFDRQVRFAPLGRAGQERLRGRHAAVVGCGALGGALAQALHRAGVGRLTLVDRDVVELSNLPRQVLFDEEHARAGLPKAEAAALALARAGGPTEVHAVADHLDAENARELLAGAEVLLDGTDNVATRYLLNDLALETERPYLYAGVVGAGGVVLPVLPGRGPCLRCLFPEPPRPGALPTCDTAGVLGPAVLSVAAWAAGRALRMLAAEDPATALEPSWVELDVWEGTLRRTRPPRDPACPACAGGERRFLAGAEGRRPLVLCGRDAVQLPPPARAPDLELLARRWSEGADEVLRAASFLRWRGGELSLTLFPDGRALVLGTDDPGRARALYDRLVGT